MLAMNTLTNIFLERLEINFSHTRLGFPLFLPMLDNSNILVPALIGKDKKQPHVGRTSFRDAMIAMTSPCRISAYLGFS